MNNFPDPSKSLDWGAFGRLTSLLEILTALKPFCQPVAPVLSPLASAVGRIAAEPVYASAPLPSCPVALRQGWTVAAQDTIGASSAAPCFASTPPIQIAFGASAPSDADAVLPPNSVDVKPFPAEIFETAAPGDGLRQPGGDFAAGDLIFGEGEFVRPDRAEFLRLAGVGAVSIRVPRVAVLGTADGGGWIAAMARREGVDCIFPAGVGLEELDLAASDLFIAIGEVGRSALERLAGPDSFSCYAAATRPGQTICGIVKGRSVSGETVFVSTPERFECVFSAWLLLARPLLRNLIGAKACDSRQSLPLSRKIASNPGWTDLVILRRTKTSDGGQVWEPIACADLAWGAIARCDAWHDVAANSEGYASGQHVFAEFL